MQGVGVIVGRRMRLGQRRGTGRGCAFQAMTQPVAQHRREDPASSRRQTRSVQQNYGGVVPAPQTEGAWRKGKPSSRSSSRAGRARIGFGPSREIPLVTREKRSAVGISRLEWFLMQRNYTAFVSFTNQRFTNKTYTTSMSMAGQQRQPPPTLTRGSTDPGEYQHDPVLAAPCVVVSSCRRLRQPGARRHPYRARDAGRGGIVHHPLYGLIDMGFRIDTMTTPPSSASTAVFRASRGGVRAGSRTWAMPAATFSWKAASTTTAPTIAPAVRPPGHRSHWKQFGEVRWDAMVFGYGWTPFASRLACVVTQFDRQHLGYKSGDFGVRRVASTAGSVLRQPGMARGYIGWAGFSPDAGAGLPEADNDRVVSAGLRYADVC